MTKWQRVAFDPRTNEQTTETTFRALCSSSFGVLQVLPKCCCHTWPRSQTLIADAIPISSTRTDADVAKVNKAKLCLLFVALVAWRAASDPKHIAKHIQWNSLRLMEEQIWDPFFPHKLCIGCLFFLRSFQKQIQATSRGPNSRWSQLPKKKTHHKKVVVHDINWLPFWWTIMHLYFNHNPLVDLSIPIFFDGPEVTSMIL